MSTAQAGMISLIMPDQSVAQQQAQQARETIICTCGGVWWQHPLRRLQAPTGLGMQLQKPARPDLKARGVGLEGCSLYHAQARPCQPVFTTRRVGRTLRSCPVATNTAQGLTKPFWFYARLDAEDKMNKLP